MMNYNYSLSSAIYSLLKFSSPEFSTFLHDIGYEGNNKTYKLFTFALRFEHYTVDGNSLTLKSPLANLYLSSPLVDTFIQNFIMGTFEAQKLELTGSSSNVSFSIVQVESLSIPQFKEYMKFKLLSPLVLSTRKEINNEFKQYYLRPNDSDEINVILTNNLKNKYKSIFKQDIDCDDVKLKWDDEYLKKHNRVTKKITINENGKYPIDVVGIQAPFTLKGNPDLIKIGYECGFGEKNSMGFGLADTDYTDYADI